MAISSKKGMIVTKNAEGKTTSQTISNVDPAAGNENIKTMLQTMGSLQSGPGHCRKTVQVFRRTGGITQWQRS